MDIAALRHSCSHIMAQAVKSLWPEVKLAIGPAIEDGFYYDFDKSGPFTDEDLAKIEEKMREIVKKDLPFIQDELDKKTAEDLFARMQEPYKVELIQGLSGAKASIYKTGEDFLDLCRGPHVNSTGQVRTFKLLSVAGAYWRGIETNPMLSRIYGTCFTAEEDLDAYLNNLEEAKKRDHRKLGPALGLFDIYYDKAGAGLVFYHPKGAILRRIIEDYEKDGHLKRGYQMVITPHIMRRELWQTSGHYDYYRENMFTFQIENREFVLKPMNCPGHILIYKSRPRSYKELPLRLFELGTVYRHERAGVLHGLLRVRGFTQDDAHIFCSQEQLKEEIKKVMEFVFSAMNDFGFEGIAIELSTRPKDSIGSDEDWQMAARALEDSLKENHLEYDINEGEGAFYGPKIDIKLKDALKRKWQCATIQCDFALPQRFDLNYTDNEGRQRRPVMLHRVILGSLERFLGALIEHYAGAFPLWLSPVQAVIIPVRKEDREYALGLMDRLTAENIRVELDNSNETLAKRIRNAQTQKSPYIIIAGQKEALSNTIALRQRSAGDQGRIEAAEFINRIKEEIKNKL